MRHAHGAARLGQARAPSFGLALEDPRTLRRTESTEPRHAKRIQCPLPIDRQPLIDEWFESGPRAVAPASMSPVEDVGKSQFMHEARQDSRATPARPGIVGVVCAGGHLAMRLRDHCRCAGGVWPVEKYSDARCASIESPPTFTRRSSHRPAFAEPASARRRSGCVIAIS